MNILEDLYYGNITPSEKCFDKQSKYGRFVELVAITEQKLSEYLDGEQKHLFTQLMNAQGEILGIGERERFIEGFSLGARFIVDTLLVQRYSPFHDIS